MPWRGSVRPRSHCKAGTYSVLRLHPRTLHVPIPSSITAAPSFLVVVFSRSSDMLVTLATPFSLTFAANTPCAYTYTPPAVLQWGSPAGSLTGGGRLGAVQRSPRAVLRRCVLGGLVTWYWVPFWPRSARRDPARRGLVRTGAHIGTQHQAQNEGYLPIVTGPVGQRPSMARAPALGPARTVEKQAQRGRS